MPKNKYNLEVMYKVSFATDNEDGSYEIFVTDDEEIAKNYISKFNALLSKLKEHYKKYEDDLFGKPWIKDEYVESHFNSWQLVNKTTCAYYNEIEYRK